MDFTITNEVFIQIETLTLHIITEGRTLTYLQITMKLSLPHIYLLATHWKSIIPDL